MKKPGKKLWVALGILVALVLATAVALPFLIDVNRYRGLIEEQAEAALGREVQLGEMQLSLLPLGVRVDDLAIRAKPEEGGGDLLTAGRLRVGARLMPLLRKKLEVDSIVIEAPELSLIRAADGRWNIQPKSSEPSEPAATTPEFHIDRLRITEGRIRLRDELGRTTPLQLTLDDLDVELQDLAPDGPVEFEMTASWQELPGAEVQLEGQLGPLFPQAAEPVELQAHVELTEIDVALLQGALGESNPLPSGLVGGTQLALTADVEASLGEATRIDVSDVAIDGVELSLVRDHAGNWNLPVAESEARGGGEGATTFAVSVNRMQVRGARLRFEDRATAEAPLVVSVDDLSLSLDQLPSQGPSQFEVAGSLDGGGMLTARGQFGPLSPEDSDFPLDLELRIERIPGSILQLANREGFELDTDNANATLATRVSGRVPSRIEADGTLELGGIQATVSRPSVRPLTIPVETRAEYEFTVAAAGSTIDIERLSVDVGGNPLSARGSIRREQQLHRLDLELLPAEVPADELRDLLMLVVGALPVSFSSGSPIELQARVHGLVGDGRIPQIDGSARLRDFSFEHPALEQPLSKVGATVTVEGERMRIEDMSAVVGASDVAGNVSIEGFDAPHVEFDLRSRNADFGELFSFISTEEVTQPGESSSETSEPPNITLNGKIAIAQGTFDSLTFSNLVAGMKWQDEVLTLDPVQMDLYDGKFNGRVTSDMRGDEPTFDIQGEAQAIDVDPFLAENLGQAGLLFGRFSGNVDTRTSGSDYEALIRGLEGTGAVEVENGRVGGLDLLETLSKVSGLFGEDTLRSLSGRLAVDGTEFVTMAGGILFEGGQMRFEKLVLESPDFKLNGDGIVNLLGASLDGEFRLNLSRQLSASMHAENSRAGQLFWNARTRSVEMPFTLEGPFTAPKPGIDWGSVADTAIRGRAEDEVRNIIAERLGLRTDEPEPPPTSEPKALTGTNRPARTASGLSAQISGTDWGGAFLTPDLELEGSVRGAGIDRAELSVVDARGIAIRERDRLRDIDKFFETTPDRQNQHSIRWVYEIDGKKLLLAKFPVTVTVVVYDTSGASTKTAVVVDR